MDMLLSTGERISCALMAMALHDLGHDASSFTGSQAGILTDGAHTKAKIVEIRAERLREALDDGHDRPGGRLPGHVRATTATSPRSAAAARTPPPWRWPRRSTPTSARSTPT